MKQSDVSQTTEPRTRKAHWKPNAEAQADYRNRQRAKAEQLERITQNAIVYLKQQGAMSDEHHDLDALDSRLQELVNEGRFL